MTKKDFFKTLKYKNAAFGLAVLLLILVAVSKSCSVDLTEKKQDPAPPPAPVVNEEKDKTPKEDTLEKGRVTTEYRYEQVRNDSALHTGLLPVYHDDMDYGGERPEDLTSIYSALFDNDTQICAARSTQIYLTQETLEKFTSLIKDLKGQTGADDLMIYDGYVPYTGDTVGNEYWGDGYDKTSTCGEHFLGTSIDLLTVASDGSYPEYTGEGKHKWMADNMANYGFIQRYPEGKEELTGQPATKNHIRYVAYPASKIITNKGWCLEEFIEEVKKYDYKDQLVFTDTHGGQYCIYYVPADKGKTTNIPVPIDGDKELKYRISGDGKEGYIVSCMVLTPQ